MKRTTIKDIAKALDITHATVSMAMNNKGNISEKMRKKILKAAEEMNYTPNSFARALVSGKTNKIAIVMPNFTSVFAMSVMSGIEGEAMKTNYDFNVYSNKPYEEKKHSALEMILKERKADAVIVITVDVPDREIKLCKDMGVPLILIEGRGSSIADNNVKVNNIKAAYNAVEYLIKKNRKKLGIILGDADITISQKERLEGVKNAMDDHGIKFSKDMVYVLHDHIFSEGVDAYAFFKNRGINAVFSAAGDIPASGFISAARKAKVKIPEDIAVIGFDDLFIAAAMDITTVRQPAEEMGIKAFDMAMKAVQKGVKEKHVETMEGKLVMRGSA